MKITLFKTVIPRSVYENILPTFRDFEQFEIKNRFYLGSNNRKKIVFGRETVKCIWRGEFIDLNTNPLNRIFSV